eukprot:TRINITY_DN6934_c0_g2_i1.p1 TRINITY_DN6934_c0_g2~~TRINITY_DN6934_c0_g2_i1.p1  ORF type:complete len:507 (-),score=129.30 TRINITY_DN6934_c0_g2_i1:18-1538(-)
MKSVLVLIFVLASSFVVSGNTIEVVNSKLQLDSFSVIDVVDIFVGESWTYMVGNFVKEIFHQDNELLVAEAESGFLIGYKKDGTVIARAIYEPVKSGFLGEEYTDIVVVTETDNIIYTNTFKNKGSDFEVTQSATKISNCDLMFHGAVRKDKKPYIIASNTGECDCADNDDSILAIYSGECKTLATSTKLVNIHNVEYHQNQIFISGSSESELTFKEDIKSTTVAPYGFVIIIPDESSTKMNALFWKDSDGTVDTSAVLSVSDMYYVIGTNSGKMVQPDVSEDSGPFVYVSSFKVKDQPFEYIKTSYVGYNHGQDFSKNDKIYISDSCITHVMVSVELADKKLVGLLVDIDTNPHIEWLELALPTFYNGKMDLITVDDTMWITVETEASLSSSELHSTILYEARINEESPENESEKEKITSTLTPTPTPNSSESEQESEIANEEENEEEVENEVEESNSHEGTSNGTTTNPEASTWGILIIVMIVAGVVGYFVSNKYLRKRSVQYN